MSCSLLNKSWYSSRWHVLLYVCLCGYLCVRGRKIAAIQGENVYPAWDKFSTLQQTPFHCKVQMSCNKKPCSGSSGAAIQAGSSTERSLYDEQKHYFETLMIPAPIGVLLSLLASAPAGRCPILTSASQPGAVKSSEVTIPAAHSSEQRKENTEDEREWWRKGYKSFGQKFLFLFPSGGFYQHTSVETCKGQKL